MVKKITATLVAALLTITLAGCANPIFVAANQNALKSLLDDPMLGFELSDKADPTCGLDYCNLNPRYVFTSNNSKQSRPGFCKALLTWATKHGADSWFFDPEYRAIPLKSHEASFQIGCATGEGALLGTAAFGVRWRLAGNSAKYELDTVMNPFGQLDDARFALTSWDDSISQLSSGVQRNFEILSAVNSYRLSHSAAKPSSRKTILKALAEVKHSSNIKLIEDGKGKVNFLQLPADGIWLKRCITIRPYNKAYFLTPNPGTGIFGTFSKQGDEPIQEFGVIASGSCP